MGRIRDGHGVEQRVACARSVEDWGFRRAEGM